MQRTEAMRRAAKKYHQTHYVPSSCRECGKSREPNMRRQGETRCLACAAIFSMKNFLDRARLTDEQRDLLFSAVRGWASVHANGSGNGAEVPPMRRDVEA